MNPCEQLLWILASLLALAIVAYRRQECFGRRVRRYDELEERYTEGVYFAPAPSRDGARRRSVP